MKQKRNASISSQTNTREKNKSQQQHRPEFHLSEESNPIIPNEFQQNNEIVGGGSMHRNLLPHINGNSSSNNVRAINPTIINFQYFPNGNESIKTNDDNDTLINSSIPNNQNVSINSDNDDNENKTTGKSTNDHSSISSKMIINQDMTTFCEEYVLGFHPTLVNNSDDDDDNSSPSENSNENNKMPKKSKKSKSSKEVPTFKSIVECDLMEFPANPSNETNVSFIPFLSEIVVDGQTYKPIKLIGSGSFGSVFLVVDEKTQNQYAVKLFSCNLTAQLAERQFIREIEIMNIANHPLVCHLKGFSFFSNYGIFTRPFIITKFYPNGSLRDAVKGKKKLDPTQKQIALYAIAIAMKYLHEIGIVHRDLKADNILFDEYNRPIICDFGLSKIMTVESMIQTTVSGSIAYMAPELLKHIEYTKSIDVYAYAFVCYELLTEKTVYEGITDILAFANDVCRKNKRPSMKIKQSIISTSFKEMIKSAWDGDPSKRPTFGQIVDDFELGNIKSKEADEKIFNEFILSLKNI